MTEGFRCTDFAYLERPNKLPAWGEAIWYKYDRLFLSNTSGDLKECFKSIETELFEDTYAYIKEGMALKAIQVYKLYKETGFKTFKDYCLKRRKQKTWWVNRIMRAAQVAWELLCNGFTELPTNVTQAYALYEPITKKTSHEYNLIETWETILELSKQQKQNITKKFIDKIANPEKKANFCQIEISKSYAEKLQQEAKEAGVSVKELVDNILRQRYGKEPKSSLKEDSTAETETDSKIPNESEWLSDLNELIKEHDNENRNQHRDDTT